MSSTRLVVGGPPHSGKSTFTAALIEAIRDLKRGQVYNISFSKMTLDLQDNSLNAILNDEQQKLDADWTTENVKQRRDKFKSKTQNLLLADAPGQITDELRILLQPADRIILIINNTKTEEIDKWESVADDLDIDVMFTLISLPSLSAGAVGWEDEDISTQRGKICSISRSDVDSQVMPCYDPTTKRMIRQIAKKILAVVSG